MTMLNPISIAPTSRKEVTSSSLADKLGSCYFDDQYLDANGSSARILPGSETETGDHVQPKSSSFFAELKRRNVYKVAIAYGVVAWLLVQVATQVFPFFDIPNWAVRLVVLAIVIGFPIALVIAWAFELTPQGLKRTEDVDLARSARQPAKRTWIFVVIIVGALSLGLFFLGRYSAPITRSATADTSAKSIAVLPFENLSDDKTNSYFADGVQDQ